MTRRTIITLAASLLLIAVGAHLVFGTQQKQTSLVTTMMSTEDFQATGLQKLTASELKSLDKWVLDWLVRVSPKPVASVVGPLRKGETEARASLRKLGAVYLVVGELDEVTKRLFSRDELQSAIELRLRRNRVPLLSEEQWAQAPGSPRLRISLTVLKSETSATYSYSCTVTLAQLTKLQRDSEFEMFATTWENGYSGFAGSSVAASAIKEVIGETVDRFSNDYLAANQ